MNKELQDILKAISFVMGLLGAISFPADFPYAHYIASTLIIWGTVQYFVAHVYADPADLPDQTKTLLTALTTQASVIKQTAATPAPQIDKAKLEAELAAMIPQVIEKVMTSQVSTPAS